MERYRRLAAIGLAVATIAGLTGLTPSLPAAQAQTPGPFDRSDVFCTKQDPPAGRRNASSPGVTPDAVTIVDNSTDHVGLRRLGINLSPYADYYKAFVAEINERCGGINGRKLILKQALGNPLAVDQAAHQQALCIKITEDYKAFAFVGTGTQGGGFPRCVSVLHKTIGLNGSPGNLSSADYADSKGRAVSRYPAIDKQAEAFISDATKQGTFKGRTVTVLGLQNRATAVQEMRDQWIDGLKQVGVDADLEVLPCTGTICKAQMGAVVSRMKANGTNTIVLTSHWFSSNIGALYKQMADQKLNARLVGPFTANIHADALMAQQIADAGRDGAEWVADKGITALVMTEVDMPGTWRAGAKETPFAKMCQEVIARRLNQKPLQLGETDATNWFGVTQTCETMHGFARALFSLGANVTTERMTAALANLKGEPSTTMPNMRTKLYYSGRDVVPDKVTEVKFNFPCPYGTNRNIGCMLAVDRPIRVRTAR